MKNYTLLDVSAYGTAPGDFALEELKIGDQVKLLFPNQEDPVHPWPVWVCLAEIKRPPLWSKHMALTEPQEDQIRYIGTITSDGNGPMLGLPVGTAIRFLRRNIAEIG